MLKEPQEYQIETVLDILNAVTPENLENFLIDFEGYLRTYSTIISTARAIFPTEFPEGAKNTDLIKPQGLVWIDDNKHNINVTIQSDEGSES